MATPQIMAINSDTDTCACCGKTNLKRVVWLKFGECDPIAYGTSCAAKSLGLNNRTYTAKDAEKLVADYNEKAVREARRTAAIESAQREADRMGEEVLVCKSGPSFYSVRTKVWDFARHGAYFATVTPMMGA